MNACASLRVVPLGMRLWQTMARRFVERGYTDPSVAGDLLTSHPPSSS